eukprot:8561657-Alexandrium_andersonii.AAC.1
MGGRGGARIFGCAAQLKIFPTACPGPGHATRFMSQACLVSTVHLAHSARSAHSVHLVRSCLLYTSDAADDM